MTTKNPIVADLLRPTGSPRSIRELRLPSVLRLLMLAPHPDDFDAIGVTLKFLQSKGHPLRVGVVYTGSGVEDAYRPGLTVKDKAALREREQRASLRFFGLPDRDLTFLHLKNDAEEQPLDVPANADAVRDFVASLAPDIVFQPHGHDTNNGHRVMYSLLGQVAAPTGLPFAALLNRDPKTLDMRADFYLPFGEDEADWKRQLLRFHDTQQQRNLNTRGYGLDDRILNFNKQTARDLSLDAPYAESFEVELHGVPPGAN